MRLDVLEEAISKGDAPVLLGYVLESAMTIIQNLTFRNQVNDGLAKCEANLLPVKQVLQLLVVLYRKLAVPDYISISQCYVHLNEPSLVATLLLTLSNGSDDDKLISYQVAFDIEHNATQEFCLKVQAALPPAPAESYPVELVEAPKEANEMQVDETAPLVTEPPVCFLYSFLYYLELILILPSLFIIIQ